jgi:hypothetical protein
MDSPVMSTSRLGNTLFCQAALNSPNTVPIKKITAVGSNAPESFCSRGPTTVAPKTSNVKRASPDVCSRAAWIDTHLAGAWLFRTRDPKMVRKILRWRSAMLPP